MNDLRFLNVMKKFSRNYAGKYVAVEGAKFLACGKSHLEAYKKAKKILATPKNLGIFYVPAKKTQPYLLLVR